MKNLSKKIVVLILVVTFVFSPVFATKAEAQWVVLDPANLADAIIKTVKEFGLDTLAWILVNKVIERIAASTVNWINSGFQGSPAYVTDPETYFKDIGDNIAGQYIFSNPNLNMLCGPIRAKIRLALTKNYIREPIYRCTLTDVVGNIDGFMDDFSQGGWDGFFELTQRTQNNPIGAYLQAENELNLQIASRQGTAQKELNWGQGFMSFKTCTEYGVATTRTIEEGGHYELQADGTNKYIEGTTKQVTDPPPCIGKEVTNTPGSVISDQLNKTLGLGNEKLAAADEINEIVSALLTQLVSNVVGGIGSGLRGLSSPGSTGDKSSANQLSTDCLDQSNNPNLETYVPNIDPNNCKNTRAFVDYFGNTTDTSILDKPIIDPYCLDGSDPVLYPDNDPTLCEFPRNSREIWPEGNGESPPFQ